MIISRKGKRIIPNIIAKAVASQLINLVIFVHIAGNRYIRLRLKMGI